MYNISKKTLVYDAVIDKRLGIEHSAGNETLYRKLLISFYKKQSETPALLEKAVMDNDFLLAFHIVHTAKNDSATIGAIRLSKILACLEESLRGDSPSFNNVVFEEYKNELSKVLDYISVLNINSQKQEIIKEDDFDLEKARLLIYKLKSDFKKGTEPNNEIIGMIYRTLAPAGKKCSILMTQIENYDFDLALNTLDEILALLNIDTNDRQNNKK